MRRLEVRVRAASTMLVGITLSIFISFNLYCQAFIIEIFILCSIYQCVNLWSEVCLSMFTLLIKEPPLIAQILLGNPKMTGTGTSGFRVLCDLKKTDSMFFYSEILHGLHV